MFYSTIRELINSIDTAQISYRNLHTNIHIQNAVNDEIIKIPYKSITRDYATFFEKCSVVLPMTHEDRARYKYKPKLLSFDLYDTTELWHALLELNNFKSVADFTLEKDIKVYVPSDFRKILNEVMVLEGVIT